MLKGARNARVVKVKIVEMLTQREHHPKPQEITITLEEVPFNVDENCVQVTPVPIYEK